MDSLSTQTDCSALILKCTELRKFENYLFDLYVQDCFFLYLHFDSMQTVIFSSILDMLKLHLHFQLTWLMKALSL